MRKLTRITTAITLLALSLAIGMSTAKADSTTPLNYVGTNFTITPPISFNYDFLTGLLTPGTLTASASGHNNQMTTTSSDTTPPDNRHGATFFGTAEPQRFCDSSGSCDTVVYQQSVCPSYPTCFSDGSFTFGGFVTRNLHGSTLDQLTFLATEYYTQSGCDGGGSPRFQIDMSNGANIQVYFGTSPEFSDCDPNSWQQACPATQCPTPNMASDTAGTRWDDSQLTCVGHTFYQTYSQAVACANSLSLTISDISIITDGGWSNGNAGTANGQTFLYRNIQINSTTRFP